MGSNISKMAEPRPAARPPSQGPSSRPDRAQKIFPRWNEVVLPTAMGSRTRSAEPTKTRAAIRAVKTIFLVESFLFFSIFLSSRNRMLPL